MNGGGGGGYEKDHDAMQVTPARVGLGSGQTIPDPSLGSVRVGPGRDMAGFASRRPYQTLGNPSMDLIFSQLIMFLHRGTIYQP
jgi:hypothetical protein